MKWFVWRIDHPGVCIDAQLGPQGLRQHLSFSPISTVLLHKRDAAGASHLRRYLVLEGCAGCPSGQCVVGCRTSLFQRLLAKYWSEAQLTIVPDGLERGPARVTVAVPASDAAALPTAAMLEQWNDAGCYLQWGMHQETVSLVGAVTVGVRQPLPTDTFQSMGWRVVRPFPWDTLRLKRWAGRAVPGPLPMPQRGSYHGVPDILGQGDR